MKWTRNCDRSWQPIGWSRRLRRLCGYAAVLMAVAALMGTVRAGAQQTPQDGQQQPTGSANEPGAGPPANASPPAVPSSQSEAPKPGAVNAERRKQIADESAVLLKLATDLKAEVDKTTKDTLSLYVIRKADQIEKLAHDVKEQMKPAIGQK